jgi:D-alanyl-D-alanine carboxypeptidase/D-alanyl-D-alanine-endopeptidase (penicillin-binding protein 4)
MLSTHDERHGARRCLRAATALALLLLSPCLAAAAELPRAVQQVLTSHHVPQSSIGVIVQEIGATNALVSVNPDVPRNPASAIKVVTTLAALEELGPDYTWATEIYTSEPVRGGVLDGDLIIKGYGDPYLVTEEFWKMLGALHRQGLDRINGDFVVDNSYFAPPAEDPGAFDNRPFHSYNVLPDALLVNFKAIYFHFYSGSNAIDIRTDPELPNLKIDNRLQPSGGSCGGYQRGITMIVPDPAVADRVVFEGRFPKACRYYTLARSALTPPAYAFGVFKSLWQQQGGSISGGLRIGKAPTDRRPTLIWRSRPLGEVIRLVNKFSNNVMTRQILLTLGAELEGEPGTNEKGAQAVNDYLAKRGIDTSSMRLDNGAGLSRDARISARMLADVLLYADSIPFSPEFISSLAILGRDGTARNRLRKRRESGHAHVKTGTIDHVSSIAGYVYAASGRRFVVVGLVNHADVHRGAGEQLWNTLIQWTYTQ